MKAKKSLGQNFLKSELALKKIVEAGEINADDIILEIGPGKGALTKKLLEHAGIVIAVEKDRELFELLKNKFAKEIVEKKLILINEDILKFEVNKILQNVVLKSIAQADEPSIANFQQKIMCGFQNNILQNFKYKIIANIPYNITGGILKKFLTGKIQPTDMILMVQHEVAKRIMGTKPASARGSGKAMKESILSISVKAYGEPSMIMKVPARYFSPEPKVDSAVIAIKNISRKLFTSPRPSPYKGEGGNGTIQNKFLNSQAFEEKFWEIVKTGFAHKRKKLSSNLKSFAKNNKHLGRNTMESLVNKRAEDLSLADWIGLAQAWDSEKAI